NRPAIGRRAADCSSADAVTVSEPRSPRCQSPAQTNTQDGRTHNQRKRLVDRLVRLVLHLDGEVESAGGLRSTLEVTRGDVQRQIAGAAGDDRPRVWRGAARSSES